MKKIMYVTLGATALLASGLAVAGSPEQAPEVSAPVVTTPQGFYLTAGAGWGYTNFAKSNLAVVSIKRNNFIWNAAAGYRFNPYFAVEGGYMQFATARIKNTMILNNTLNQSLYASAPYIAAKGILPINDQFDVFGQAGVGYTFMSSKGFAGTVNINRHKHPILPILAIGADYNINQNLAVTLKGIATVKSGPMPATYGATIGLTYYFG